MIPEATKALYNAFSKLTSLPKASPVDFISGPKTVSTLRNFANENTGALTKTLSLSSGWYPGVKPWSSILSPNTHLVAIWDIGTPVILDKNGTVREERGFTSNTYTLFSLSTMNWMLYKPTNSKPSPILVP